MCCIGWAKSGIAAVTPIMIYWGSAVIKRSTVVKSCFLNLYSHRRLSPLSFSFLTWFTWFTLFSEFWNWSMAVSSQIARQVKSGCTSPSPCHGLFESLGSLHCEEIQHVFVRCQLWAVDEDARGVKTNPLWRDAQLWGANDMALPPCRLLDWT